MGGPEAQSLAGAPETVADVGSEVDGAGISRAPTRGVEAPPDPHLPSLGEVESGPAAPIHPTGNALLAADVGTVYTKVYLLEDVAGERRLVALGRAPTLGGDGTPAAGEALAQALTQALRRAGRERHPVPEQRLLLTSAGMVPRLAMVAPGGADARALRSSLEGLPVRLLEPVLLEGAGRDPEHLLGQIEVQAPDAVIVAGGGRPAERALAGAAVEAISRGFGRQGPLVLLIGDAEFIAQVSPILEGDRAHVAGDDPRAAVQDLAGRFVEERLAGLDSASGGLGAWSGGGAGSSLEGVCAATRLIADRYDVDVLTLDLGAAHAMAVACLGQSGRRRVVVATRDDLGLRLGRQTILRETGTEALSAWLPIDVAGEALRLDARQGAAIPAAVPETVDDLLLEHAYAREALRLLLEDLARRLGGDGGVTGSATALPPIDLVIGSGGVLAGVPRLTQAALILLDAVQPDALTQLALDRATALSLLGSIGTQDGPAALGAALERDGLLNLGLCIAPVGAGKEGEPAIKVEVVYATRSPVTVDVAVGAIEVVPLPIGERASLKLWPARDFDIGLGQGSAATPRAEVEGGAVGIIVDARGRPLALPGSREKRQAKLLQWLQSTGAYPQFSFVHHPSHRPGEVAAQTIGPSGGPP